jgi:antitoxin PrlF
VFDPEPGEKMSYKANVTLSPKGQLTLPASLRNLWNLKAGDRLNLEFDEDGRAVMTKRVRRSILESRKDLQPLSLGRPLTQADIDEAVASEMIEQEIRIRKCAKRSVSTTFSRSSASRLAAIRRSPWIQTPRNVTCSRS